MLKNSWAKELFSNPSNIKEIKEKLPRLFQIAEIESSRAGKIGMEVGTLREKIMISFFLYKMGSEKVNVNIPTTQPEVDVVVNDEPISIKTITGNGKVKAVWTVDASSAQKFIRGYKPKCSILLVKINWGKEGGMFFIPLEVQKKIFNKMGGDAYLDMPRAGTNPRGVEFSREALSKMLSHIETLKIPIFWIKRDIDYDIYKRWVEYWKEEVQ